MRVNIQFVKENQRFPFRFIDFLNGLFLILPIILVLLSFAMIRSYNMNNMTGLNGLLIASMTIGLIGLAIVVLIVNRLIQNIKFTKIITGLDFNSNVELIKNSFYKLYDSQFIDTRNIHKGLIIANSGTSLFSWGEINTAICDDKVIYINSRPTGQPITIFENKLNIKRIIKKIEIEKKPSPQHTV